MQYNPKKIEEKWRKKWDRAGSPKAIDPAPEKKGLGKKFYALVEFPYPSGEGLHIGHAFTFNLMDIFARKKRLEGKNVLYPMGWDAFGLPTENYAIRTGIHPAKATKDNTDRFREQMKKLAFAYNWSREVNTTNPDYYKWTQWIFIQLFKHGLAYKKEMKINWCPACKIGLANEEVVDGKCERCGEKVGHKKLSQWLLRITLYADRLADELDLVVYPSSVVAAQRNWIGRSEGMIIKFPIEGKKAEIPVFTTRPDTLFGTTFFVLAPEHEMVEKLTTPEHKEKVEKYVKQAKEKMELERIAEMGEKTGVFTGSCVLNPLNNKKIPVYAADFVVMGYGTGAVMGVPGHDQRDWDFAKKYNLPIRQVILGIRKAVNQFDDFSSLQEPYVGSGVLINSGEYNSLKSEEAKEKIFKALVEKGLAEKSTQYHIRDWIFSRQHYWGEPIPMIYCENCAQKGITFWNKKEGKKMKPLFEPIGDLAGWFPVPENELPVKLPEVERYEPTGTGESPLAAIKDFVNAKCPYCGGLARRETDTMPNWAGSSWYFLRYCDPENNGMLANPKKLEYWMPVDVYLGGAEHTTLHLLYSRFWHKFLNDIEIVLEKEPYQKRRVHGVILGEDGQRMSKTRGNIVNPEEMIEKFGVDTLRTYLAFIGPYDGVFPWSTAGIKGTKRFLERLNDYILAQIEVGAKKETDETQALVHRLIKDVGDAIDEFKFNTAVAKFMKFLNEIKDKNISLKNLKKVLLVLSPFAPYLTEELWSSFAEASEDKEFGAEDSVHNQPWPKYDEKLIKQEKIVLIVQINGKVRDKISTRPGGVENEMKELALSSEKVKKWLKSKKIKKTIFVPDRLINFVV